MDPSSTSFVPVKDLLSQADQILDQLALRGYLSQSDQDWITKKLYHVHDLVQCVTSSTLRPEECVQPEASAGVDPREDIFTPHFDLSHIEDANECVEPEVWQGRKETCLTQLGPKSETGNDQIVRLATLSKHDVDGLSASPELSGTASENEPHELRKLDAGGCTPAIYTSDLDTDRDKIRHCDLKGNPAQLSNPFAESKAHLMMQKMGWQVGQGLGVSSQGRVEPVLAVLKHDLGGIGMDAYIENTRIVQDTKPVSDDTSWDKAPKLSEKAIRGFNRLYKERPVGKNGIPKSGHPMLIRHAGVVVQLFTDGPALRGQTLCTVIYNVPKDEYEHRVHFSGTVVRALESGGARGSSNLTVAAGDDLKLLQQHKDHVIAQSVQTGQKGLIKIFAMVLENEALLKLADDDDEFSD